MISFKEWTPESAAEWRARFQAWARRLGVEDISGVEIQRWIHLLHIAFARLMRERFQNLPLSQPRVRILFYLYFLTRGPSPEYPDGVPFSELRRWRGVTKGTLSVLVRRLEQEGWVERIPDPADRRRVRLRLSDAAVADIERQAPHHLAFLNALVADLTPEERATLVHLLEKLLFSLQRRAHRDDFAGRGITPSERDR